LNFYFLSICETNTSVDVLTICLSVIIPAIFLIVAIIALLIPSIRKKIVPYRDKTKYRSTSKGSRSDKVGTLE